MRTTVRTPLPGARRIARSGDARSCARARTRMNCARVGDPGPASRPAGIHADSPVGESSGGLRRAAPAKDVGAQLTFPSGRAGPLDVVFQPNQRCAQLFAPPSERASHREIRRRAQLRACSDENELRARWGGAVCPASAVVSLLSEHAKPCAPRFTLRPNEPPPVNAGHRDDAGAGRRPAVRRSPTAGGPVQL